MSIPAEKSPHPARPLPEHVAVIMDGNGRWARSHTLPRQAGHRAGAKAARRIVEACGRRGIRYLTLFAFSSENWRRPRREVGALMKLFLDVLDREVADLHRNDVRLRFVGDRANLSPAIQDRMRASEARTAGNTGLQLFVALSYGGRWDITRAARRLAEAVAAGELAPGDIDEAAVAGQLCLAGVPDPDLLIRTGGESRISNFLLWNLAYAECWFTDRLWPLFDEADLDLALDFFASRQRRFGRVPEEAEEA